MSLVVKKAPSTKAVYETSLFGIQNLTNEEGKTYPEIADLLPSENQIFNINLETRKVDVQKPLSVQYDHNAEVIYFKCPRYYDNMDLTNTVCIIQYINANGQAGLYWVPWYDVNHYDKDPEHPEIRTPMILIPWAVGGLATVASGFIKFNVRFYKIASDGKTFIYNLSTSPAVGEILHGMNLTEEELNKFELPASVVEEIYNNLKIVKENATTYWIDV